MNSGFMVLVWVGKVAGVYIGVCGNGEVIGAVKVPIVLNGMVD